MDTALVSRRRRGIGQSFYFMKYLFFDTETTGLPINMNVPYTDTNNWPRLVQLAWMVLDDEGKLFHEKEFIIFPENFNIPIAASNIHGITTQKAIEDGLGLKSVLEVLEFESSGVDFIVCHNADFDLSILGCEIYRIKGRNPLDFKPTYCTQKQTTELLQIPKNKGRGYGRYKWPSLDELHHWCFNKGFDNAHNALADVTATKDCFFFLKKNYPGIFKETYKH